MSNLLKNNRDLMNEYCYERNENLNLDRLTIGSNEKIWWKCSKGHEWQAMIGNRTKGQRCPYCSGKKVLKGFNDLQTVIPDLASEWHATKNGNLKPCDVTKGSNKKVWWMCSKGHEWQACICHRSKGAGCPYCCQYNSHRHMRRGICETGRGKSGSTSV